MVQEIIKFNTLKTLSTINKDSNLKKIFERKFGTYNFIKLKNDILSNKLNREISSFMESIFLEVISNKEDLLKIYGKVELKTKTPRRYGKIQINKDILKQGGIATELQLSMLNLAHLKTITLNLLDKGVSDHYRGTDNFTLENLKLINSAIRDFEVKMKKIKDN